MKKLSEKWQGELALNDENNEKQLIRKFKTNKRFQTFLNKHFTS